MESGGASAPQLLLLASSSALTAVFYSVYRRRASAVERLKGAQKLSLDQDLVRLLSETPGRCVPYAVIEGAVRSVKQTLNSQFVEHCGGVIERLTLREEKMVWNRTTHLWNNTEKLLHQRTNTVPFSLCSPDGGVSVRVLRPLEAAELQLETVYESFHPAAQTLSNVLGHFLSGERPRGITESEEMLRVGDSVTGVGELVLDNNLLRLQPPKQGLQYFLSRCDYASLLQRRSAGLRRWRILTAVCAAAAAATLLLLLWRRCRLHRERRRQRSLMQDFLLLQKGSIQQVQLQEAAPDSCSVCFSRQRSLVFLHCGHVCCCSPCYALLQQPPQCPICRAPIQRVVPLYNS
ncbi:hypothetical protein PBY51_001229 [Eleginops maclovinus]|uniref:RING-type E3 ubiquitin transferase n=1 Tax=Eleginops maclovinus TaxID=56733 RepID=A0AAN7XLF3_ELEMC|nr:hypothetical protein PBY51_001229 [Eleginops maclovinus]